MNGNYPTACEPGGSMGSISRPTITQRLSGEKENLEKRLNEINTALELLKKNPEFESCINALGRIML